MDNTLNTKTYRNFYSDVEKLRQYWQGFKPPTLEESSYLDKWKQISPLINQISSQNAALVLLWHAVDNTFIYAADAKGITGFDCSLYTAPTGMEFSLSNMHPDTLPAMFVMQQVAFNHLLQHKEKELTRVIVSMDGLYKNSQGEYFHFLQQIMAVEVDSSGHPLIYLSYIYDISVLKKENTSNLVVTSPGEAVIWNYDFTTKELEQTQELSAQERKVLTYLARGKQSKEIAAELFLSPHTIDTHRRNLLKKTNCTNTTGLVSYARMVGLF